MDVHERMIAPPVTVNPDTPLQDALKTLFQHHCQRLLVVDEGGKPLGIVSKGDVPYTSSSPTPRLSIFEQHYRLRTLHVQDVMTDILATAMPNTSLQDASHLMAANDADCLAVVDQDGRVVGVINKKDLP